MTLVEKGSASNSLREGGHQFFRFCVVGAIGFCVDAGLLEGILWTGLLDPLTGRLLSFACAVMVTFACNRRWSFKNGRSNPFWRTFGRYMAIQGFGFGCNYSIYTTLYLLLPPPFNRPLLCLVGGSAFALAVNFLGARFLVFRSSRRAD